VGAAGSDGARREGGVNRPPVAVELFAGAGGAALGLGAAGFEAQVCVDSDASAVATLCAAGFPGLCARVEDLDPELYAGAELVWASPPCQPYAQGGKREGEDDPRDGWPATFAFVRGARPRWVVIENVRGAPADRWARELERAGFTEAEARELDAADYGVPQRRRRLFVVAGPRRIRWPRPTHYGPDLPFLLRGDRRPWVTLRAALGVQGTAETREEEWLDRPAPTVTTCEVKGTRGPAMFHPTRAGVQRGSRPDRVSDALWLATGQRRATLLEVAVLQAFPPGYPFQGTVDARYRQVGNAVPPPLAEALGRAVFAAMREAA